MQVFADVRRRVLDNGLTLLVREDRSTPVVALNFFVRVGSLNEDDAIAGWSHGIEHMLFKGTARRGPGDIAREIQNAGGETNAGTGYESTNYYIVLPSSNLEAAVDIHADVLRHSVFDEDELEKERQVLIKENEMYRDHPAGYGFTWEGLLAEAFTAHRYRRAIGGPDENLLRVGREAIVTFKETYYVPNNITYVVVGDVDADAVFRLLETKLGDWPRRDVRPDASPVEPPQKALRLRVAEGDVEKAYVKIGFHVPPELHPDTDALLVLAHILGTGRASRLYRRVREEQGLILTNSILDTTGIDAGYLVIEFSAEPEKLEPALDAVIREMLRFAGEPPTPEEMDRTLRTVENDLLYTMETMEGQAHLLGHYALLGDYRLAGGYLERLTRVTRDHIRDAARRYLTLDQATVHVYGPPGTARGWTAQDLRRRLGEAAPSAPGPRPVTAAAPVLRTPIPAASGRSRGEPELVVLDGETRIVLAPDGRLPLVAVAAYLPMGSGVETEAEAGLVRLTQTCLLKGAGGRSSAEISEALEGMGARLRPFASRDACGVSLSVSRGALAPALDLFRTVLSRPDFPEEAVGRERVRTLAELASLRDDTVQYTVTDFYRQLFPGHPYGRPVEGTEASVSRFTAEDCRRCHGWLHDRRGLVLSVVGDFDREEILREVAHTLAALPRGEGAQRSVPRGSARPDGGANELHKDVSQAVIVLGYPGPRTDAPDRFALEVWNAIMSGMGNRLFTRLRDEQHLCYFTGTFVSPLREGGAVGAYVGTGPEQIEEAREALTRELARSVEELPAEEELRRAQNNLAGTFLIDMQTRMAWASSYARDEVSGLGFEESLRYLDAIRQVTAAQVQEAAARYVRASGLVVSVLRPSGDAAPVAEEVEA